MGKRTEAPYTHSASGKRTKNAINSVARNSNFVRSCNSMADVFISYKREEIAHAERVAEALLAEGYSTFHDVGDSGINAGETWDQRIEHELLACKAVVVLWSPRATQSDNVRDEARRAHHRGILVPAFIEKCTVPIGLGLLQAADLCRWKGSMKDAQWRFLVDRGVAVKVGRIVERHSVTVVHPPTPLVPPAPRAPLAPKAPAAPRPPIKFHIPGTPTLFLDTLVRSDLATLGLREFQEASVRIGCEWEALAAVAQTESGPLGGFAADGRMIVLFERHLFSRKTNHQYDASHPTVSNPTPGGYPRTQADRWAQIAEAYALDPEAALQSASYGRFQPLGHNFPNLGMSNAHEYVAKLARSEKDQLDAFEAFVVANSLAQELRRKDWAGFARGYNGPGYAANKYDQKMARAYANLKVTPLT